MVYIIRLAAICWPDRFDVYRQSRISTLNPNLLAPPGLHVGSFGLWPLSIDHLLGVIVCVYADDFGDFGIFSVGVAPPPPRCFVDRTRPMSLGSPPHVGRPPSHLFEIVGRHLRKFAGEVLEPLHVLGSLLKEVLASALRYVRLPVAIANRLALYGGQRAV